jgi:hypothetical protein
LGGDFERKGVFAQRSNDFNHSINNKWLKLNCTLITIMNYSRLIAFWTTEIAYCVQLREAVIAGNTDPRMY